MSESATSFLITSGILVVLALFVPCTESLVRLALRLRRKRSAGSVSQPIRTYKGDIA